MGALRNNRHALKHGGARAVKQFERGQPLTGSALDARNLIEVELAEVGPIGMVTRNTKDRQAIADCYKAAILGCTDSDKMHNYVKVWAWLEGGASRNWLAIAAYSKENRGDAVVDAALKAAKAVQDEQKSE